MISLRRPMLPDCEGTIKWLVYLPYDELVAIFYGITVKLERCYLEDEPRRLFVTAKCNHERIHVTHSLEIEIVQISEGTFELRC